MDDLIRLITTENFSMIIAAFLIFWIVRDLKKELSELHKSLGEQSKQIAKTTKAVLLLVLAENGTRKKAKEEAQKMIQEELDEG